MPDTFDRWTQILAWCEQGSHDLALAALDQCATDQVEPGGEWLLCRGYLQWASGSPALALEALEQAELRVPLPPLVYCIMAECCLALEARAAANTLLMGLVEEEDWPDSILGPLARGLYYVGQHDASLRVCRMAAERYPESDEALWWLARNLEATGAPCRTRLDVLLRAHRLEPAEPRYALELAFFYAEQQDLATAHHFAALTPLDNLCCGECLGRLTRIFAAHGDGQRLGECHERLASLPASQEHEEPLDLLFAEEERPDLAALLGGLTPAPRED